MGGTPERSEAEDLFEEAAGWLGFAAPSLVALASVRLLDESEKGDQPFQALPSELLEGLAVLSSRGLGAWGRASAGVRRAVRARAEELAALQPELRARAEELAAIKHVLRARELARVLGSQPPEPQPWAPAPRPGGLRTH